MKIELMEPAGRPRLVNRAGPAIPGGADFGHELCRGQVGSGRFSGVRRRAEEPGLRLYRCIRRGPGAVPGHPPGAGLSGVLCGPDPTSSGDGDDGGGDDQPAAPGRENHRPRPDAVQSHAPLEWVEVGPRRNIRLIDLGWRAGGRVWPGGSGPCPGGPDGDTPVDYSIVFGAVSRGQGVRSPGAPEWVARAYGREPRRKKPR